ncbi:LpqB family beta-propeller domain-containing protein [Streptomyces sp. NPDC021093]|uniref:LpqB family beta-propeller domain-containing protein n=1 Tax=Streptomyces sp. NPDC021093 TaxID=3365112 RepID=UPI00378D21A0
MTAVGCGSMPDHGDVREVKGPQAVDSQVRVYSVPPRSGARPDEIVEGFLEAMKSDDPGFDTARKYLTKSASREWNPSEATAVLDEGPSRQEPSVRDNGATPVYTLTGRQVALLDKQSAYQPAKKQYSQKLRLVREKGSDKKPDSGEWRIDTPPKGLVLGASDFQRIFRSVNKYYFASDSATIDPKERWLVADPVYVRKRTDPQSRLDPVAQAVTALLDGPSNWLKPVVSSRFPTGATLKGGVKALTIGDHNSLKVPLNAKAANVNHRGCMEMAAQLLFTLRDLTSTSRLEQVEIEDSEESQLCVLTGDQAGAYAPGGSSRTPDFQYFLNDKQRLVRIPNDPNDVDTNEAKPVPGALGENGPQLKSVGVSRDERYVAGVSADGHHLRVASMAAGSGAPDPLYTSKAKTKEPLSAPSWDSRNDLWIADRDPKAPRLLRMADGTGKPEEIPVEGLGDGYVDSLRVSADGVRIALLVVDEKGRKTLRVGRIERRGAGEESAVAVVGLRAGAPQMEQVTAMSWAGHSRLVVVGREKDGVQQMRYVQTDGSTSAAGLLPGANQVTAVAASDVDRFPLLAQSQEDGILRLYPGANWKTVAREGSLPVYPG